MVAWTPPFGDGEKESSLGSESVGWDLTPIGMMVRDVELSLPYREGHERGFYLVRWCGHWLAVFLASPPWGRRERGFIVESHHAD